MTNEEFNKLIEDVKLIERVKEQTTKELNEKFVLIPKNRLWSFLGGATSFAIAAFALSWAGVLAGMKSDKAVQAANRIEAISTEVEKHRDALKIGSYVSYGTPVTLTSKANQNPPKILTALGLSGPEKGAHTRIESPNNSDAQKWIIETAISK